MRISIAAVTPRRANLNCPRSGEAQHKQVPQTPGRQIVLKYAAAPCPASTEHLPREILGCGLANVRIMTLTFCAEKEGPGNCVEQGQR